mmetsp:Transcript_22736/g.77371  ORF Transcript_22736/g.77371 Transcript_22736/m.77371 type:complete len:226 (-) Transcript_22736:960-1637(-)
MDSAPAYTDACHPPPAAGRGGAAILRSSAAASPSSWRPSASCDSDSARISDAVALSSGEAAAPGDGGDLGAWLAAAPPSGPGVAGGPGSRSCRFPELGRMSFSANLRLASSSAKLKACVRCSFCTISMYESAVYVPSRPSLRPVSSTASRILPCTCTKFLPMPSMRSSFTLTMSSLSVTELRLMMAPILYPSAISPPRIFTLTSNLILGDTMKGPSVTNSSNMSV